VSKLFAKPLPGGSFFMLLLFVGEGKVDAVLAQGGHQVT
jgi:hypothetical protein